MKGKEKVVEINTQIKEKIGFASILYDRLYIINKAFDSTDKARVRESLHTCFDNLTPYLDVNTKSKIKKKIKALRDISDKEQFFEEAYEIYEDLLKVLKKRDMLMKPSAKLLKLLKLEIEEVQKNFKAKSTNEIRNLKRKIKENEAKMDALVDNLATRTITPEVYKKYSQKYEKEIKNTSDRLKVLDKDYNTSFDFIDKCMILASTLSRLHKVFSFRQRKNLAKALFKRIWVKDKEIKKIELNPPFDFLFKDRIKKIKSSFPDLVFERYPVEGTKKDKFEHLAEAINSPVYSIVLNLIKPISTNDDLTE